MKKQAQKTRIRYMVNDEGNVVKARVWVCDAYRFFKASMMKRRKTPILNLTIPETVIIADEAVSTGDVCLGCGIFRPRVLRDSNSVNLTI